MNGFHLHATLRHHIGRHGGIDAAGEQHHRPSADAGGQAARTRFGGAVDIGGQIPHLHVHGVLRVMDIYLHPRVGFRQPSADLLRQLDGGQGEALVRALGLDLEGLGAVQIVSQIVFDGGKDRVQVLLAGAAAAQAHHAENGTAGFPCPVHVRFLVHRLYVHRGLEDIHVKIAVLLHAAADVLPQLVLKLALVRALQDDLAQLQ